MRYGRRIGSNSLTVCARSGNSSVGLKEKGCKTCNQPRYADRVGKASGEWRVAMKLARLSGLNCR